MNLNTHKGIIGLIPIVIIFLLTAGAALYFARTSLEIVPPPGHVWSGACTDDAMQCLDGSYVGRTGPKCEFMPCPDMGYPPPGGGMGGGMGGDSGASSGTGCTSDAQCLSSQTCVALEGVSTVDPGDDIGGAFGLPKGKSKAKNG